MALSEPEQITAGIALVGAAFGYGKLYQTVNTLKDQIEKWEPLFVRLSTSWFLQDVPPHGEIEIRRMARDAEKRRRTPGG